MHKPQAISTSKNTDDELGENKKPESRVQINGTAVSLLLMGLLNC